MTINDIAPVARESTAGIIARQLRHAIMTGALAPGTQLTEAELASQFEVSRGPLREAMQRLVQEGLLRSELHRGLFVIDLEAEDVDDIYLARTAVERAAMTRILRSSELRASATGQLEEVQQQMAEATDSDALSDADLRFHEVLVEASGSKRLVRMAETLLIETRMCLAALQRTYPSGEERVQEHRRIVDAVRDGHEDLALDLLDAHMTDAVDRLTPPP
ncbi:MAG: GntR family transcriptional regulator [Micromonosporaceae bacterium]